MLLNNTRSAFGYRVQALGAHVLLRLGFQIDAINRAGHPDIIATVDGMEYRFEVEAETMGPRLHQLTNDDFDSLTEVSGSVGYYALAVSSPSPYWVLVPAEDLVGRNPSPVMLLEALSDKGLSGEWTREYLELLSKSCRLIRRTSFGSLCESALAGHSL